jgi:hypothetical protein
MSGTQQQAGEEPGEQAGPPARKRWLRVPSLGQTAALVGVVGGIVGLVFVFRPGWKPQAPVDVGKADVTNVRVRQPVTFERYPQHLKLPPGTVSKEQLARSGVLITFHVQISGFKGKELPLRWELNDKATGALVSENDAVSLVPSTNDEGRVWFVWVPSPKRARDYYVTVTIYQPPKGGVDVPLQDFDTDTFRGVPAGA